MLHQLLTATFFLSVNIMVKPPIIIGPVLIHYKKTFQTYHFFASSLVGQRRELEQLHVHGRDGEKALINAFGQVFKYAMHLSCFIHVRKNIKKQLQKY